MSKFFLNLFQWRSRMQFWQTCWFFSQRTKQILDHHPNTKKKNFFKTFAQMVSLDTYKAVPTEFPQKKQLQFQKVTAENPKNKKLQPFVLNFFLWNGRISFDKHGNVFLPAGQKLQAENPKTKNKLLGFLDTLVFSKWFLWARTMQFWQTCRKFLGRIWRKVRSSSKKKQKKLTFLIKMFLWRSKTKF